jgi:hypothetical protein
MKLINLSNDLILYIGIYLNNPFNFNRINKYFRKNFYFFSLNKLYSLQYLLFPKFNKYLLDQINCLFKYYRYLFFR